ncbi:MAG TPA: M23 family metallopeptidase, partial [Planctomycetota bacterium]|nr:M23 family metallopeptidase [Planctomycetota bacterium]
MLPTPSSLQVSRRADLRRIGSGRTAVLFADFAVDRPEALPAVLAHQFAFEASPPVKLLRDDPRDSKGEHVLEDFLVPVSPSKPIALSPPLSGGPWKCSGATDPTSLHQHETTVVLGEGRARIPERFAIDFQQIDDRGDLLLSPFPDEISNDLFYGYGEEVLAVTDSAVASVLDGVPENTPQASGEIKFARPISRDTNAGNQVVLDLGEGRYAFYAHLQPGSLRVRTGDRVRRGQVLGLVGNSGNSVGPHLHFHVGDRASLNGCEGLPFVFDSFDVVGQWPDHFKPTPASVEPRRHEGEIPVKDAV